MSCLPPDPALGSATALAPDPLGCASRDAALACACSATVLAGRPARHELADRRKLAARPLHKFATCRLLRAPVPGSSFTPFARSRSTRVARAASSPNTERAHLMGRARQAPALMDEEERDAAANRCWATTRKSWHQTAAVTRK
jgi:hypothetical protein